MDERGVDEEGMREEREREMRGCSASLYSPISKTMQGSDMERNSISSAYSQPIPLPPWVRVAENIAF